MSAHRVLVARGRGPPRPSSVFYTKLKEVKRMHKADTARFEEEKSDRQESMLTKPHFHGEFIWTPNVSGALLSHVKLQTVVIRPLLARLSPRRDSVGERSLCERNQRKSRLLGAQAWGAISVLSLHHSEMPQEQLNISGVILGDSWPTEVMTTTSGLSHSILGVLPLPDVLSGSASCLCFPCAMFTLRHTLFTKWIPEAPG